MFFTRSTMFIEASRVLCAPILLLGSEKGSERIGMRMPRRCIAWGVVAFALWDAGIAWAQQNPLARGTITAPRFAVANRLPVVTLRPATGLSPFVAACGDTSGTLYVGAEVEPHIAVNR
jgi:hypothetical protein